MVPQNCQSTIRNIITLARLHYFNGHFDSFKSDIVPLKLLKGLGSNSVKQYVKLMTSFRRGSLANRKFYL
jgi:hypothetical protein